MPTSTGSPPPPATTPNSTPSSCDYTPKPPAAAGTPNSALTLRPADLDPEQSLIRLHEKGDTLRWQPISPTLMTYLQHHIEQRPAPCSEPVLRHRTGRPITARRYDHLWQRIGTHLPWVATQQISTHWLRHTTLTWVERNYGYAIARAYAGHTDSPADGSTTTYIRATIHEIATAVAALTNEPHPLANRQEVT